MDTVTPSVPGLDDAWPAPQGGGGPDRLAAALRHLSPTVCGDPSSRPGSRLARPQTGPGDAGDARSPLVRVGTVRASRGSEGPRRDGRVLHFGATWSRSRCALAASAGHPGPRGAAPRSPAPGLRLPGAQDSPRGVPAPRCAPLTRPLGQKRGSWGPRRWLHPGLPIRDAPQGEATRARAAAAPRGHARVPRLPGDLGRRRGPSWAVSAASRRVAPQRHVLVLSDVRPKLGHRRARPW